MGNHKLLRPLAYAILYMIHQLIIFEHDDQLVFAFVAKDATRLFVGVDGVLVLYQLFGFLEIVLAVLYTLHKLFSQPYLLGHVFWVHRKHLLTYWHYPVIQ